MKRVCVALSIAFCLVMLTLLWAAGASDRALAHGPSARCAPPFTRRSLASQGTPPTVVALDNGYRISFLDVTYNADGTSTWRYYVEELPSAQDLSNWVLELPGCTGVVDASPEPWEVVHPDPNLHLNGIKWETGAGFQQGEFTVTLTGHWAVGVRRVGAKGPDAAWGEIAGPICEEAVQLVGQKTVDPTVAQPGDVLTYALAITNAGTSWAYTAVLTDPIPVSTTYVGASVQAPTGYVEYDEADELIRWQGDLAPGQAVTITFMVWVHDDVLPGTQITNAAYLGPDVFTATTWIEAAEAPAWALLVYLSADNNLDNPEYRIIRDWEAFNALERAVTFNPRLQVYVQWDRSPDHAGDTPDDHTRRYRVRPDLNPFRLAPYTEGLDTWDLGERNMGEGLTLYDFITWARARYTSAYEALSIIGHGGGWSPTLDPALGYQACLPTGIAWDDSSGDYLSTRELGQVLYWATDEQDDPLDVLFLDASTMAMLENAYEVSDSARYLVASQGAAWARFAYDRYLAGVDDATAPLDLAVRIVEEYAASLEGYPLTMGAIAVDLTSLGPVANAVDDLAVVLSDTLTSTRPTIAEAYTATQKFDSNWDIELAPPDAYLDLYDLAYQLHHLVPATETEVLTATQAVTDALAGAIVAETHRDGHPWIAPSVTWTFSGAHGLSIYLPVGEDTWLRDYYRGTELALAADTRWDEFIHEGWYAGQTPPSGRLPGPPVTVPEPWGRLSSVPTAVPEPIDPAHRPGLLSIQRFWSFLPIVSR
jgi:uncharacterized repeat protein (TIGR01451 family)